MNSTHISIIIFLLCVNLTQITCAISPGNLTDTTDDSEYTQKWVKLLDKFESFVNPKTNELLIELNAVKSRLNVSAKCVTSIESLLLRATKDDWALKSKTCFKYVYNLNKFN